MPSILDRLDIPPLYFKRSHTLTRPMSEEQSRAVRDDATRFAARLLDNYKQQLARPQPRAD